jgi:lysophospholipid hydrolase
MAFSVNTEPINAPQKRLSKLRNKVQIIQSEISKYTSGRIRQFPIYANQQHKNDFARLARRLCGKAVGLVLGGGGARGISQVGIIRAMEEAGIPIDMVGGTSIGAFNGGLYARDADHVPMYGRAKKFSGRMASLWRMALDATWPTVSYTTGHEVQKNMFFCYA